MRNLSLYLLLVTLAGCTTSGSGSMNAPGPSAASVTYASVNNSRNSGVDVNAINAAIAANRGPYWAPEDEVFQQSISEEF